MIKIYKSRRDKREHVRIVKFDTIDEKEWVQCSCVATRAFCDSDLHLKIYGNIEKFKDHMIMYYGPENVVEE
jgi:hypothetical protein